MLGSTQLSSVINKQFHTHKWTTTRTRIRDTPTKHINIGHMFRLSAHTQLSWSDKNGSMCWFDNDGKQLLAPRHTSSRVAPFTFMTLTDPFMHRDAQFAFLRVHCVVAHTRCQLSNDRGPTKDAPVLKMTVTQVPDGWSKVWSGVSVAAWIMNYLYATMLT
jgi:hypothetical protein